MSTHPQKQAHGLWSSPLSAALVSQRIRLDHVCWDSDGQTLVWLEGRSGKGVLVAQTGSEARRELTDEQNVRGGVGYGGGEFSVHQGVVFFADSSVRLYRRGLGQERPKPITPPFGSAAGMEVSPDGQWVAYVHTDGKTDLLGLVPSDGSQWPQQLARGADFYMDLAWSPDGKHLAWIEWDHPNMPWDGTRLVLAELQGESPRVSSRRVAAGDGGTPVCQPQFSPDGKWLSYIISRGEWDDLELLNLESGEKRVLVEGRNFHLGTPGWVQGIRTYGWSADGQKVYTIRNYGGFFSLWQVDVASGRQEQVDTQPYTYLSQLSVSTTGQLAMIASASNIPDRVICLADGAIRVVARSETESIDPAFLPVAKPLQWSGPGGTPVHGLYYVPSNPNYQSDGLPPAIVDIHGGPTSLAPARYNAELAYFTSRGYAYLRVNYRGSTGYGHSYQAAMDQAWGLVDVEDAAGGAKALADQKLADGRRLAISGGSAGGFTVLNTLIRYPGLFRVGINCFGVSNLFAFAMDTHKFEAHYLDTLVGALPEAEDRYHEWSPAFHADQIRDPLAVFQGSDDKVVPPNQSEQIVEALRRKGVAHVYRLYAGEGHGFRKNETLLDYYQQVESFLKQYLLFAPTGKQD